MGTRLRHWQVLVQIADLGTMRRAADAVGLSQPAVSHLLTDLETLMEGPLFLRHARGMSITPLGQALLPISRRLLAAVSDGAEHVAVLNARATGVVRLAAHAGAIAGLLVRAIPEFALEYPDILVQIQQADESQIMNLLNHDQVDLALCRAPGLVSDGWQFTPLFDDHLVVVAGPEHPLAGPEPVAIDILRHQTWLAWPVATAMQEAFQRLFEDDAPLPLQRLVSTMAPAMMWAMLRAEPLLTLVPASIARQLIEAGELAQIPVTKTLPIRPIGLLQSIDPRGAACQKMVQFLEDFVAVPKNDGRRSAPKCDLESPRIP